MAEPIYSWSAVDKVKKPASISDPITSPYAGSPATPNQGPAAPGAQPAQGGYGGTAGGFAGLGPVAPQDGKQPSFSDALTENPLAKPLVTSASQALMDNLQAKPVKSFTDTLARNNFIKGADEATRKVMEASAGSGRAATGQIGGDAARFLGSEIMPQRSALEATLAGQAQDRADAKQQNAINSFTSLAGTTQQGEIAKAQLETTVSENAKDREVTVSESALGRELQKYITDTGLAMDGRQLEESIRQFDNRLDFDEWATKAGLDDAAADRMWKSNEADVQRKWESGENLSTQEHQIHLANVQGEIAEHQARVEQVLNLDTLEKKAEIDKVMAGILNGYQVDRDETSMSHDEAMEKLKASLTGELEQRGYDHDTAMQAAEIQATAIQKDQDRQTETLMAQAELAYKYKALADQVGLSQEEIQLKKDTLEQDLTLSLGQLGLDKKKVDAAIKSQTFQDRQGVIATMMEMGGDSQDVIDKAAGMYVALLADPTLPGGALISPEEKDAMLAAIKAGPTADAADAAKVEAMNKAVAAARDAAAKNDPRGMQGAR